jgi:hypothetical protein
LRSRSDNTPFFGQIDAAEEMDITDCHFKKVRGLSDPNGVSFESVKWPGNYLRHKGPDTPVKVISGFLDPWFAADATFTPRWASGAPSWAKVLEFESVNNSGYFLRAKAGVLVLSRWDSSEPYEIGFNETRPGSLGRAVNWGGWTVRGTAPEVAFIERSGACTGLTPFLGAPRRTALAFSLSTGRVVRCTATSTPFAGFSPWMRVEGHPDFTPDVYLIKRQVNPCIW